MPTTFRTWHEASQGPIPGVRHFTPMDRSSSGGTRNWWMKDEAEELGLQGKRMSMNLLSQLGKNLTGDFSMSSRRPMVPAPNYVPTGGVYSQGQVDAMSNLQRANLQQQAGTATNNFASSLGARGFSPMSTPLLDFYGQNAMMRANAGAAKNETEFNFNAAKANRDAQIAAQGVNANLYGSYSDALARLADVQMRGQLQGQGQKFDLLKILLGQLG